MRNQPIFEWDEESLIAVCILTDGEDVFYGTARCHETDADMANEKTGCEIAFRRARIKLYRHYRDTCKTKLNALNQLYYSMNTSKRFNPKSYENRMLQRQIHMTEFDLDTAKEMIAGEEQSLREYITEKDNFYKKIRANREKAAKSEQLF